MTDPHGKQRHGVHSFFSAAHEIEYLKKGLKMTARSGQMMMMTWVQRVFEEEDEGREQTFDY